MENGLNIDVETLKFLYKRYKELTIPVVVILVCFILLIKFIVPQFQTVFTLSREAKKDASKLIVLKNNLNLLSRLNDSLLDPQLEIVSAALPTNKDFIGIINAISFASSLAGVSVGDFQLQIGDISSVSTDTSKFSSIALNLSINGSVSDINKFISALYVTLPLSEVSSISMGGTSSTVAVNFYYKPLPPISYSEGSPISSISNSWLKVIDTLSNFNYNLSSSFESFSSPSSSISPL